MKKIVVLCGLCITSIFASLYAQQPQFITDSLDIYINREMKQWQIPAVAVAIVKDGKIICSNGYGVTNISTNQKTDANSLFMIASNTKAFTATALCLLNTEGRLSLDNKVATYLPDFKLYDPCASDMVTVRDLLCHRIGMETFQGDFFNWGNDLTRKDIINNIQKNKPTYDFRTTWGYCNSAFVAAGEIIPAVTDTSWDDFIKNRFFIPLDMTRSSTTYEAIKADKNACLPYTISNNKLVALNYDNLNNLAPCASINSCVNDIAQWLLVQLNTGNYHGKQIFPEESILETRIPNSIVSDGQSYLYKSQHFDLYGLGLGITDYEGKKMVWHTGGADGFVTTVCMVPEENLGIAIFTNTDANYFFEACMYQILEAYLHLPYRNLSDIYYSFYAANTQQADAQIQDWKLTANKNIKPELDITSYTGKYKNDVYGDMDITLENNKLIMHFSHHPQLTGLLQCMGENTFLCTYTPISWGIKQLPFTVVNGHVQSVTVTVNDFIDFGSYVFTKL